uniref:Methyltransferase domain-containing protein n=1 Tax=Heterosigma akashiwo TaxID=2829 RepID=A0A7S3Y0A8_HETAK
MKAHSLLHHRIMLSVYCLIFLGLSSSAEEESKCSAKVLKDFLGRKYTAFVQIPVGIDAEANVEIYAPLQLNLLIDETQEVVSTFCSQHTGPLWGLSCGDFVSKILSEVHFLFYLKLAELLSDYLLCWGIDLTRGIEGHSGQYPGKIKVFQRLVQEYRSMSTVCEIGFNAGHSAMAFLAASSRIRVVSFDLGTNRAPKGSGQTYAARAQDFVSSVFPGRSILVVGNASYTVPTFAEFSHPFRCDFILVDGGHSYEQAVDDLQNMKLLAQSGRNVVLIDDLEYEGVYKAWETHIRLGTLNEHIILDQIFQSSGCHVTDLIVTEHSPLRTQEEGTHSKDIVRLDIFVGVGWMRNNVFAPSPNKTQRCLAQPLVQTILGLGSYNSIAV